MQGALFLAGGNGCVGEDVAFFLTAFSAEIEGTIWRGNFRVCQVVEQTDKISFDNCLFDKTADEAIWIKQKNAKIGHNDTICFLVRFLMIFF